MDFEISEPKQSRDDLDMTKQKATARESTSSRKRI